MYRISTNDRLFINQFIEDDPQLLPWSLAASRPHCLVRTLVTRNDERLTCLERRTAETGRPGSQIALCENTTVRPIVNRSVIVSHESEWLYLASGSGLASTTSQPIRLPGLVR